MKNTVRWVALATVVLFTTNAWAVWNPDTDANLLFNMNFESYNNGTHTTTDVKAGLVGTVYDYNTTYPDLFGETSRAGLGYDANFAAIHDIATGAGMDGIVESPNDVKLKVAPLGSTLFNLSSASAKWQTDQRTWTFWFNAPKLEGSIIRHASMYLSDDAYVNKLWEIRITAGGTLQFYHKDNCLRMETASSLGELGVTVDTWHHVAVVIDRSNVVETTDPTTLLSAKMYVDGLEVPVIVTSYNTNTMNVGFYDEPLWIGAGDREFDGLLDDVRYYNRDLNSLEVSFLNQPESNIPRAWSPIPRSSNVIIGTDLTWVPANGATAQSVYFGTDVNNLVLKTGAASDKRTNAEIGGPLQLNKKYYWYVRSTISGVDSNGPLWWFNSETGQAIYPSPADGAEDINNGDVNLMWTTPTAATYAVYVSTNRSLVESNSTDPNVRIANGISVPYINGFDPCNIGSRGDTYYWRVNSTYPSLGVTVAGKIWSFRTKPYELVFNTAGVTTTYVDHVLNAYDCNVHGDGWSYVTTGSLASDGVVVFDFPSGFNYDHRYDITVVPVLRSTDVNAIRFPTPIAIHVTGDFYYDGRAELAGDDTTTNTYDYSAARSGGYPGPKHNCGIDGSIFNDTDTHPATVSDYWTIYNMPAGYDGRFSAIGGPKPIAVPTALAKTTWGPGIPVNPPYKGGGGGGAGGAGGDAGRGFFFGVNTAGPSYGDKEVPVPFGGSAGGWGKTAGGSAGGGGIEIVATGDVVLDVNAQIRAYGGGQLYSVAVGDGAAGGGGGGGSVRIIADGSVTNKGIINVNGGKGGNADTKTNNASGGGGGGRVAIFHGTGYSNTGTITANGGARGYWTDVNLLHTSLAQNGQNGTILVTSGSPKKASAPTPANGDNMVYTGHPDPCTIQLKWYSGYGGTTDEVFCDTNPTPTTSQGSVSATRGQHSVSMTVSSGNTYYMKVVTDGSVSSDTWSFKTVNWRCRQFDGADIAPTDVNHVSGPEWDNNRNCVLDIDDLDFFVENWLNLGFDQYTLRFNYFNRFAREWLECHNRTDNGCDGFPTSH